MTINLDTVVSLIAILVVWGRFEHRFTKLETLFDLLHPELKIRKH